MKMMIFVLIVVLGLGGFMVYGYLINNKGPETKSYSEKPLNTTDSEFNDYKIIGDDKDSIIEQNRAKAELQLQKNKDLFDENQKSEKRPGLVDRATGFIKDNFPNKSIFNKVKARATNDVNQGSDAINNVLEKTNVDYFVSNEAADNLYKDEDIRIEAAGGYIWQNSLLSDVVALPVIIKKTEVDSGNKEDTKLIPRFTIPSNSIFSTVNTTALLGRIPTGGEVQDAFRFSLKIKDIGFFANNHKHSLLSGIVLSGTATGDLLLSCVRASIDSITYIFDDGTISQNNDADVATITDRFGYPCIKGTLVTNAPVTIGAAALLSGLSSAAQAVANSERTVSTDSSGNSNSQITGDSEKFGIYSAISGVMNNTHEWVNERAKSSFDVIVASAGQDIQLFFNKQVSIDYNPVGRKLIHKNFNSNRGAYAVFD